LTTGLPRADAGQQAGEGDNSDEGTKIIPSAYKESRMREAMNRPPMMENRKEKAFISELPEHSPFGYFQIGLGLDSALKVKTAFPLFRFVGGRAFLRPFQGIG
jgi:hypothetical protein